MAAGLGFKTFNTGDVLSAADVNGYLMQGVLVFADATARDAAITSPQEGQFAYLKDTNVTTYYTGSAWANLDTTGMTNPMTTTGDTIYSSSGSTPARLGIGSTGQVLTVAGGVPTWAAPAGGGKVLQVVQGTFTGTAQTTSTTMASTGLTVSITPSSASSKVLILASISGVAKTGGNVNTAVKLELVRGATKIMDLSDVNAYNNTTDYQDIGSVAANCLDTPATTSATSYTINFASYQSGQTVYINNYRASDTTRSSIIAMEIGA